MEDLVESLPLYNSPLPSRHYSGYLRGLGGGSLLHYYFVESSDSNPLSSPIVVWMNGGPGCSSMEGWGYEIGPFRFLSQQKLSNHSAAPFVLNNFSWTLHSSVLFLEAPPGVGFSYSASDNYTISDTGNAKNNYAALVDFFTTKFPEYNRTRSLFVAAESYGGIYGPTLVQEIISNRELKTTLAGMIIGNGESTQCLNGKGSGCNVYVTGDLKFAFYHGLVDEKFYFEGVAACMNITSRECAMNMEQLFLTYEANVNPYDIYSKCIGGEGSDWQRYFLFGSLRRRLEVFARSKGFASVEEMTVKNGVPAVQPPGLSVPCIDTVAMTSYLNRDDVKRALHVVSSFNWSICSQINYVRDVADVASIYLQMIQSEHLPILVFNGNCDAGIPYTEVDYWLRHDLALPVTQGFHPWNYTTVSDGSVQFGGDATQFGELLWFVTANGAGHMAAQSQPEAALHMFERFISGRDF